MKRPAYVPLAAAAIAVGLAGCAPTTRTASPAAEPLAGVQNPSLHILTDSARGAPASGTFGWGYCLFRIVQHPDYPISALHERIQRALLDALTAKGLAFSETQPDLLVSFALAGEGALDVSELNRASGELFRQPLTPDASGDLHYKRGVFILDVADRATGRVLWRGAMLADFELAWPEDRKQERARAVADELLRHYPHPR